MIRSKEVGTQIKANIIMISGLSMDYGLSIDFKECEELMDRIVALKKETFDLVDQLSKGEADNGKMGRPKKVNLYEGMVIGLSNYVMRTAEKDNPTDMELEAMVEVTKILFRTV